MGAAWSPRNPLSFSTNVTLCASLDNALAENLRFPCPTQETAKPDFAPKLHLGVEEARREGVPPSSLKLFAQPKVSPAPVSGIGRVPLSRCIFLSLDRDQDVSCWLVLS